jgi:hypothetical protein
VADYSDCPHTNISLLEAQHTELISSAGHTHANPRPASHDRQVRKGKGKGQSPEDRNDTQSNSIQRTEFEFARRIHVAQSYLSALERGEKEPGAAVLLAISREFGKSVDWLLTGKPHIEPKRKVTGYSPQSN